MTNYSGVTAERWARFTKTQQLLQVALEMHRARQYLNATNLENLRVGYVRVLQLTDLTLQVQTNPGLLDELSRWRSLVVDLQRREAARARNPRVGASGPASARPRSLGADSVLVSATSLNRFSPSAR